MKFSDYAAESRNRIQGQLRTFLEQKAKELSPASRNPDELFQLLQEYSSSGKMLRGTLAMLGYDLCKKRKFASFSSAKAIRLAAAQELFQAGLLVHDDIMDGDATRRGKPTMHKVFEHKALQAGRSSAEKLGEALGICAGDIFYFLAWQLLPSGARNLNQLFSDELSKVCLAQMQDVELGTSSTFPSMQEIINVYIYKTARYTIAIPLLAGAMLAGNTELLAPIETIGINLGIVFQLQDDYLGLYADEATLGKPLGSDIREGKKTPFMVLLHESLNNEEHVAFSRIFGNKSITDDNVDYVRSLLEKYAIVDKVRAMMADLSKNAQTILQDKIFKTPSINYDSSSVLVDFIEYSSERSF